MLYPHSTRNRPTPDSKHTAPKLFKKMSSDENERNWLNYVGRAPMSTKNVISLTSKDSKNKGFSKKKGQVGMITLSKHSSKASLTQPQLHSSHKQQPKDHQHRSLRKESSSKHLKLTTSTSSQLPHLLAKSASHTTIHRKAQQDNKLRLLEKMGLKKKLSEKNAKKGTEIGDFRMGRKLGSGRFGNVYLAQERATRCLYALKVMSKSKVKEAEMEEQVFWQIKLQMFMSHPNILKLYHFFHDQKNIYLVLEYCSQCLFRELRSRNKYSEQDTAYYGKQVVSALKFMHNQSIIHRDIKPQNIMLQWGVIKLSDFGWSTYAPIYKRQTFCGTADYVPPQIVEGNHYDERVDIWALGVLFYELASGKAPFETKDQNITYDKIVNASCRYPSHFSVGLKEMIGRILDKNPAGRPDLQQIEGWQWFQRHKGVGRFISREIWNVWGRMD